ncbi:hypothetical protein NHF40_01190 [Maricaulaceae bacterium EIL42A08]|nr:hypothetical protein [Maricaulaceae bacterium EIL42A08]
MISADVLESAARHLLADNEFRREINTDEVHAAYLDLLEGPEVKPGDLLDTRDPTTKEFMAVASQLSFEGQVSLYWRHLAREGFLHKPETTLAVCLASRWIYLLLANAGLLGASQQGGWTGQDHIAAYRTTFGRWLTRDQKLTIYRLPAAVARRFAPSLEKSVLSRGTFNQHDDAKFLARLKPLSQHDNFAARLIAESAARRSL